MTSHPHRRQVLLFLVALILPSAALVGLGLRMLAQERELAQSRLADEQRRAVALIRQDILGRLERIKLEELGALATAPARGEERSYLNPEVALVATVVEGHPDCRGRVGTRYKVLNPSHPHRTFLDSSNKPNWRNLEGTTTEPLSPSTAKHLRRLATPLNRDMRG